MRFKLLLLGLCLLTLVGEAAQRIPGVGRFTVPRAAEQAACTTTIDAGTSVATTVSNAAAGSVVCLRTGTHTGLTFTSINKSPAVTVRPETTSTAVTLNAIAFNGSVAGITLDAYQNGAGTWFNSSGVDFNSSGTKTNLVIRGITFTSTTAQAITVDGNITGAYGTSEIAHFSANNVNCSEGGGPDNRIIFDATGTGGTMALVLRFGTISGGSSDGVRFGGSTSAGGSIEDIFFDSVVEGAHTGCHTDATQVYGGRNNIVRDCYYFNGDIGFAAYDGTSDLLVENNIFDHGSESDLRPEILEVYSCDNCEVAHNTLLHRTACGSDGCAMIDINHKEGIDDPGDNIIVRDNIASGISVSAGTTNLTRNNNLLRSGATGTEISGSPTYVGGATPSTVAGFALDTGSLGENGSTTGTDIGAAVGEVLLALAFPLHRTEIPTLFAWQFPKPTGMPASFAAWKARQSVKLGRIQDARGWLDTAHRIMGAR